MGKQYIIGHGSLFDNSGKQHIKGALIDIDDFSYLKDREKSFVKKGYLLIPGKPKKAEPTPLELQIQDKLNKVKQLNEIHKKEKAEFKVIKENFYKEADQKFKDLEEEKAEFEKEKAEFMASKKSKKGGK